MHLPERKKEWSGEAGAFTQVDASSLFCLCILFWEMVHLLVVIVQSGNI